MKEAEKNIIEAISTLGDKVDAGQIAEELDITRPTVQMECKRMREAGLLDWETDRSRGRKIVYSLKP